MNLVITIGSGRRNRELSDYIEKMVNEGGESAYEKVLGYKREDKMRKNYSESVQGIIAYKKIRGGCI